MSGAAASSLETRLSAYLSGQTGQPVAVSGLTRLAGGVSRETWAFQVGGCGPDVPLPRRLVLRMDTAQPFIAGTRAAEFQVIRLAGQHGVPVPRMLFCEEDPAVLGAGFLIMEHVDGEALVSRLHADPRYEHARQALPGQMAAALARIHRVTPADDPGVAAALPHLPVQAAVAHLEGLYRQWAVDPHPVLELALRWLHAHAPPQTPLALVHGDFRPGNLLFDETGLRAVLDWELASWGDPLADVAWVALRSWRAGRDDQAVGGLCAREDFHRAYRDAGGRPVEPGPMRFWELFATARWAVVTVMELGGFLAGVHNLELATLGRRTAEIEWDLLALLERAEP